jgi:heme-degrading monooxygenase HmoA
MTKKNFVYMWEYLVKENFLEDFIHHYGPEGDWVQLFRKAGGYIKTDLHQDCTNPKRFMTVDFWESKNDRDNFRKEFSTEFAELDQRCEQFTETEKILGDFDMVQ